MVSGMFNKKKLMSIVSIVILSIIFFFNFSGVAYANYYNDKYNPKGSWTEDADKSIYGDSATVSYDEDASGEYDKEPVWLEKIIAEFLIAITDGLYFLIEKIGITIDNVIYGRVGDHTKNGIALFRFELQKGNPYGIVASVIYNVLSGIAIIFIVVTMFGKFSVAMYYSGSGKKWSEFKSSIGTSILAMALIVMMPYFLDVGLYLADVILYTVSREGSLNLFGSAGGLNLVESFREGASETQSFINALIYLSTVVLSLYFATIYIGYALTMVVLFVSFPIICVGMNFDKKMLSSWTKQVLSILLIPIMDCILMMIPIYFGLLPNSASNAILKIFVCAMVVPARNVFRQLLGLGSTGLELSGVATMMGAARLVGAAGGAISKFRGGQRASNEDGNMSNFYEELAKNEGQSQSSGGGGSPIGGSPGGGSVPGSPAGGVPSISYGGVSTENVAPGIQGGAASDGSISYMGKESTDTGTTGGSLDSAVEGNRVDRRSAEKYANIHNFENQAFAGGLSNEKRAELYRQRSKQRNKSAVLSAAGSLAGGVLGAGSGMFMGAGYQTNMGALGIMAGGAVGEMASGIGSNASSPKPTVYPQAASQQEPASQQEEKIPYYEGEVVNNVPSGSGGAGIDPPIDMQKSSGMITSNEGTGYESHDEPFNETPPDLQRCAQEYRNNNAKIAYTIGSNTAIKYTNNNGEKLRPIYNEVVEENKGKDMSNNELRNETRKKATEQIMKEYKQTYNNSAFQTASTEVNNFGSKKFEEVVQGHVDNRDSGYLSEDVFDTFDWMPRRDNKDK